MKRLFNMLLVAVLDTALLVAGESGAVAAFHPKRIELAEIKGDSGILYETGNEEIRGFTVTWKDWQGKAVEEPFLRIFDDSVAEGVISGFPEPRVPIRLRGDARTYHDYLSGPRKAGDISIDVQRASGGGVEAIVVNGKKQPLYDGVYAPKLSANGKHYAYCAVSKAAKKQFPIIDGKKQDEFDWCTGIVFSPDGNRYAYIAGVDGSAFAVVDGKAGRRYPCKTSEVITTGRYFGYHYFNGPELIVWGPRSRKVAYVLSEFWGTTGRVFVNEKQISPLESKISLSEWSEDGKHLAYIAGVEGGKEVMVLDGKKLEDHGDICDFGFSPDGDQLAYIVSDSEPGQPPCRVICNGRSGPRFYAPSVSGKISWVHNVNGVAFSPDGRHLAYVARDSTHGGKWFVMLDGRKLKKYDDILTVSAFRGNRVVYIAVLKGDRTTRVVQVADPLR